MLKAILIVILCAIQHSNLVSSSTSTVTCQDSYECKDETIEGTYIKCYGYYGCENATISGTYSYNYGYLAAYSSHQSVPYTFSSGLYSMLDSEVETTTSKVYGYLGAAYVEYSAYSTSLSISLMGYLSGYSSDVVCSSGEACSIYCGEVYGCYDLTFYCYSGATCYYDCSDDSDYCPTLYSGVEADVVGLTPISRLNSHESGLSDEEITNRYIVNKNKKTTIEKLSLPESQINWNQLKNGEEMKELLKEKLYKLRGETISNSKKSIINTHSNSNNDNKNKNNNANNKNDNQFKLFQDNTNLLDSNNDNKNKNNEYSKTPDQKIDNDVDVNGATKERVKDRGAGLLDDMFTPGGVFMLCIGIIFTLSTVKVINVCNKYDNGKLFTKKRMKKKMKKNHSRLSMIQENDHEMDEDNLENQSSYVSIGDGNDEDNNDDDDNNSIQNEINDEHNQEYQSLLP